LGIDVEILCKLAAPHPCEKAPSMQTTAAVQCPRCFEQLEVIEWLFAALNSVEMARLPWSLFKFSGDTEDTPGRKSLDKFLEARLQHMEQALAGREWLAGSFSVADILMADVLRLVERFDGLAGYPACQDYVGRATARPSFVKAHTDQMAHFAAAD